MLANGLDHVVALAFSRTDCDIPMRRYPEGWRPHTKKLVEIKTIIKQTEEMMREIDPKQLRELFEFGPSLGGGRPKVSLTYDGSHFLAKYEASLDTLPEQPGN